MIVFGFYLNRFGVFNQTNLKNLVNKIYACKITHRLIKSRPAVKLVATLLQNIIKTNMSTSEYLNNKTNRPKIKMLK